MVERRDAVGIAVLDYEKALHFPIVLLSGKGMTAQQHYILSVLLFSFEYQVLYSMGNLFDLLDDLFFFPFLSLMSLSLLSFCLGLTCAALILKLTQGCTF